MVSGNHVPSTVRLEFQVGSGDSNGQDNSDKQPEERVTSEEEFYIIGNDEGRAGAPHTVSGGVMNTKTRYLTKPNYPPAARAVYAGGTVNVQVLIETDGTAFSAKSLTGNPLLLSASRGAACRSSFMPTLLRGLPVKVWGIIIYNFVPWARVRSPSVS
jgi:outer membrane biosynthesis protein TonB